MPEAASFRKSLRSRCAVLGRSDDVSVDSPARLPGRVIGHLQRPQRHVRRSNHPSPQVVRLIRERRGPGQARELFAFDNQQINRILPNLLPVFLRPSVRLAGICVTSRITEQRGKSSGCSIDQKIKSNHGTCKRPLCTLFEQFLKVLGTFGFLKNYLGAFEILIWVQGVFGIFA